MEKLRLHLIALSTPEKKAFARRLGTSLAYLQKLVYSGGKLKLGPALCVKIERDTKRAIRCEDLRSDIDWDYLREEAGGKP